MHSRFKYLRTDAEKAVGYTADGRAYFATMVELTDYCAKLRAATRRVVDRLLARCEELLRQGWALWRDEWRAFHERTDSRRDHHIWYFCEFRERNDVSKV